LTIKGFLLIIYTIRLFSNSFSQFRIKFYHNFGHHFSGTVSSEKNLMNLYGSKLEEETISETRDEVTEPPMYRVLLHNDDYTTMEFVVEVLMFVFNKSTEESTRIMLNVHRQGMGLCGLYTYEIAETKVDAVHNLARERGFPLKCSMEKD